jgi:hypothetical protein
MLRRTLDAVLDAVEPATSPRCGGRTEPWWPPPSTDLAELDLERLAEEFTARYQAQAYPAVLIGAPHGALAYLAALLGAAWLPSTVDVVASTPLPGRASPAAALALAAKVADGLGRSAPEVQVTQRYPIVGNRAEFSVAFGRLPTAYRLFLARRLRPGAPVLVVRETGAVPLLRDDRARQAQLQCAEHDRAQFLTAAARGRYLTAPAGGGAAAMRAGLAADALRRARVLGLPSGQLLYRERDLLSEVVADVVRAVRRTAGAHTDWLVVQQGPTRLDPAPLLRGAVPFWCDGDGEAAEWWVAGAPQFDRITVLLDPRSRPASVASASWKGICMLAGQSAMLDSHGRLPAREPRLRGVGHPVEPLPRLAPLDVLDRLGELAHLSDVLMV